MKNIVIKYCLIEVYGKVYFGDMNKLYNPCLHVKHLIKNF